MDPQKMLFDLVNACSQKSVNRDRSNAIILAANVLAAWLNNGGFSPSAIRQKQVAPGGNVCFEIKDRTSTTQ